MCLIKLPKNVYLKNTEDTESILCDQVFMAHITSAMMYVLLCLTTRMCVLNGLNEARGIV